MRYPSFTGEEPCCEVGVDLFFADEYEARYMDLRGAKEVCGTCWMQTECAEYAIHHDVQGVWGGLSLNERITIRKRRNIQPIPMAIGA